MLISDEKQSCKVEGESNYRYEFVLKITDAMSIKVLSSSCVIIFLFYDYILFVLFTHCNEN